jgi:hypothetical protein
LVLGGLENLHLKSLGIVVRVQLEIDFLLCSLVEFLVHTQHVQKRYQILHKLDPRKFHFPFTQKFLPLSFDFVGSQQPENFPQERGIPEPIQRIIFTELLRKLFLCDSIIQSEMSFDVHLENIPESLGVHPFKASHQLEYNFHHNFLPRLLTDPL